MVARTIEGVLTPEVIRECADPARAEEVAAELISGASGGAEGAPWQSSGRALLSRYLLAAGRSGTDVSTMVRWVEDPADPAPLQVLSEQAESLPEGWIRLGTELPDDVQASTRFMVLSVLTGTS
ncbi:hypothetical protein ACIG5E_34445 [Kitasatospora sp. NPDC053057]|uniref:hypothetical protein n=1 Tax=Kitasatospora sp. NPDC053057 TaxID=3364062 RepID=UPI0037C78E3B